MTQTNFRILTLDGGGIKGAFTASVLAELESHTGFSCVDHFDLITGTSTGGIIALGLGLGCSAEQLRDFYRGHGPEIFPVTGVVKSGAAKLRHLFEPKHHIDKLREALVSVLGERLLGESRCRLVIPSYDASYPRIYLFKTAHHERHVDDYEIPAVEVALATGAAPTYFAATEIAGHAGAAYIDGGVWANCPVRVGLTEAVHFLGQNPSRIDILSIGTTTPPSTVSPKRRQGGILRWNAGLLELMMRAQAEAALAEASLLTGGRLHRIDATPERNRFSLDNARMVQDLIALGRAEAAKKVHRQAVEARFLNGLQAPEFLPLHALAKRRRPAEEP